MAHRHSHMNNLYVLWYTVSKGCYKKWCKILLLKISPFKQCAVGDVNML